MFKQPKQYPTDWLLRTLLVLLLGLLGALGAAAQITGTITGNVLDPTAATVSGAKVTARHQETGATRVTTTGTDGRFVLAGMPPGIYQIRVEASGFRPVVQEEIRLSVAETVTLRFRLEVGEISVAVTVRESSVLVQTQDTELSYLVSEGVIRELPLNGRNYTDLALLQPGVVAYPHRDGGSVVAHGLGLSVNGQDYRSNVFLLDGTPQNDFTNGPAGSAAGTVLGVETIREFRVEVNAYSAEFGRNSGGQVNAITRSGTNDLHGSAYWYHRNDNLDARNFFDLPPVGKPEFKRNQMGATLGGPIRRDRSFFFLGYESLRERQGRTISTVVPDDNARLGQLPSTTNPCGPLTSVTIHPSVQPYVNEFPVANAGLIRDSNGCPTGLASYLFGFKQTIDQDFGQARYDRNIGSAGQFFMRYTYDGAEQQLPTDFPQFPRAFLSRNQFFTAAYQHVQSANTLHNFRLGFSRTRITQAVEANTSQPLSPFIAGRDSMGSIDIGGMPRFGPQSSVNVQLVQNIIGFEYAWTQTRGRHLLKAGALIERYQDNMFNPTFSLGIFTFANLRAFLLNQPQRFVGLPITGALDRYWRFTLFGFYLQDSWRLHPRLTLNAGLRYEFATLPRDIHGRDSALIHLTDPAPTVGQLYQNPTYKNLMPRIGLAWDPFGTGKTSIRASYGLFFNTNNQQNLIVTVTNPPATPRVIFGAPGPGLTFPQPNLAAGSANSIRPVQWDLKNPNVHVWNLTVQQQFWRETVLTVGYAGSRGVHLLRSGDWNVATPVRQPDGSYFFPAGSPRRNPNFSTIELKSSDGNSWYNSMIVELRTRLGRDLTAQSSYTFSRNIDTTQASTFFSDATNGTTTAFPEFPGLDYNKGLADFHAKHNWVFNFIWQIPFARNQSGVAKALLDGWQIAGIATVRSGPPLTLFVQRNISRSLWSPSNGPGIGFDRPNIRPGFTAESAVLGLPNQWFDPAAFQLPLPGTLGNLGRGALTGPNLRTFDFSLAKTASIAVGQRETQLQFRVEAFNLFNRTNLGIPSLIAFGGNCPPQPIRPDGTCSDDAPLSTLGRIRSTVTSSRQIQLGLRFQF